MGIISWIILGLIAGFIGSKIVDKQGQGFWLNIALGIARRLGGWISVRSLRCDRRHRLQHLQHDRRSCRVDRCAADLYNA